MSNIESTQSDVDTPNSTLSTLSQIFGNMTTEDNPITNANDLDDAALVEPLVAYGRAVSALLDAGIASGTEHHAVGYIIGITSTISAALEIDSQA